MSRKKRKKETRFPLAFGQQTLVAATKGMSSQRNHRQPALLDNTVDRLQSCDFFYEMLE